LEAAQELLNVSKLEIEKAGRDLYNLCSSPPKQGAPGWGKKLLFATEL
jgi:hypothetical protein